MRNAVKFLTGAHQDRRLREVTLALAVAVLEMTGIEPEKAEAALDSGAAAERFGLMVAELGGPTDLPRDTKPTRGRTADTRHPLPGR